MCWWWSGGRLQVWMFQLLSLLCINNFLVRCDDKRLTLAIPPLNKQPPKFEMLNTTRVTIQEESIPPHCIFNLRAFDPDILNKTAPQNISYFIHEGQEEFKVDKNGCVKVKKPLDRDIPNGHRVWQLTVGAYDEWGLTPSKKMAHQVLLVILDDINDNEPYIYAGAQSVVWYENRPRGTITKLTALDDDGGGSDGSHRGGISVHGAPFQFSIDPGASDEIKTYFKIHNGVLATETDNFDREEKKEYLVPLRIIDGGKPPKTGNVNFTVVIGDENDNEMLSGESKIFVYKNKEKSTFPIGRVYVQDLDDWDLPDKTFSWNSSGGRPYFELDPETGYISMKPITPAGNYQLKFKVTDNKRLEVVGANVTVTVKEIPDEAIHNSGSIRFMGITKEIFINPEENGKSKKDILEDTLADIFEVVKDSIDVFAVLSSWYSRDPTMVDVRYSVHSPHYWKSEKLDGLLSEKKGTLEKALQLKVFTIGIDECTSRNRDCKSICTNEMIQSKIPYKIYGNTTSFVGVDAYAFPRCTTSASVLPPKNDCIPNIPCLHGGIIIINTTDHDGWRCECEASYDGPRCEITSVSFHGKGYAWYPALTALCKECVLEIQFTTGHKNGLLLYNGPIFPSPFTLKDFISLELVEGKPLLLVNFGSGVFRLEISNSFHLNDSKPHHISIGWNSKGISMRVDNCLRNESTCYTDYIRPFGFFPFNELNVNGPLQVGGFSSLSFRFPDTNNFTGCISNLTYNGMYYDLGNPSYARNMDVTSCDQAIVGAGYKSNNLCKEFSCGDGKCATNLVPCEEEADDCVNNPYGIHCSGDNEGLLVPLFSLQDSNATINPQETVKLVCNVPIDQHSSKIVWTWENQAVADWPSSFTYSFTDDNSTLTIEFLEDKVNGTFECTAYLIGQPKVVAFINIVVAAFEKPYFLVTNLENSTKTWKKNERLQLICVADGRPKPKMFWEWQEELKENKSSSLAMVFSLKHDNRSLFLTNITTTTKVRFICTGENQEGKIVEYVDVSSTDDNPVDIQKIIIISGVIAVAILAIVLGITVAVFKYKKQKNNSFLSALSMKEFYEGNVENLNPEVGVSDQAHLLPFSQQKWEIARDRLELGKTLGSGAFGLVLEARAVGVVEGEKCSTVAVKTVIPMADETHYKALIMELKIMAHLGKHLNVVNLIGAVTKNLLKNKELLVVMEFCKYGSLLKYMHSNMKSFINQLDPKTDRIDPGFMPILEADQNDKRGDYQETELESFKSTDLLCWAYQAAKGMEYLASRNVLHGDLAARNVLLAENHIVKICDFGFAREKNYDYQKNINGVLLPIKWMAVESINSGIFSSKSDCWSFGVLLWEIFTLGDKPYPGMVIDADFLERLKDGYRMDKPQYAPTSVYQLMLECWAEDPSSRPRFGEVAERLKELVSTCVYTTLVDLNDEYNRTNDRGARNKMSEEIDYFGTMGPAKKYSTATSVLGGETGPALVTDFPTCSISVNTKNVRYTSPESSFRASGQSVEFLSSNSTLKGYK